jgi:D-beta-D-heptose 7-phosphate kinase/D-beta-D-heptose 1-phosphate adenosyltransferase
MILPPPPADRLRRLLSRVGGVHVVVVGDVMLDRFLVGTVTRISPEAPVPVVRHSRSYVRLGGAANVAANVAALDARVSLVGVVGQDAAAADLRTALELAGIGADGLVTDPSRPTVEKLRIVTERNQQVARVDYENDDDVGGEIEARLADRISTSEPANVVVVSDYLKGTITAAVMDAVSRLGAAGVPTLIDPKIPHLHLYRGATLVTPNHHEAETATHRRIRSDEEARAAGEAFRQLTGCRAALITRGEQGMWLASPDATGTIPAVAREVADVTGAGDTVVATIAAALGAGASLAEAATLANHAAGIVVGKFGTATVTGEELRRSLEGF